MPRHRDAGGRHRLGEIAALYGELARMVPSPVVELNRAVAVAMAEGPTPGWLLVDELDAAGTLDGYHLLPATRADLLRRLGRTDEAAAAYREALAARRHRDRAAVPRPPPGRRDHRPLSPARAGERGLGVSVCRIPFVGGVRAPPPGERVRTEVRQCFYRTRSPSCTAAGCDRRGGGPQFAREGARVFLAGRTADRLKAVAADIVEGGGDAEWAVVDALDPDAVRAHADEVVAAAGGLDISFNAIGVDHVQGQPLTELAPADFSFPIATYTTTQFLTATAAARHMRERGSGVILLLLDDRVPGGAVDRRVRARLCRGRGPVGAAQGELGPHGVRVVCLRPDGIAESVDQGSHVRTCSPALPSPRA